ncbi:protein SseB [Klebsiella pneumoniae]|nr:protein SseB [Klebsiella pneumoniae]
MIGIEAEGDIEAIIHTTGSVATDTLPGDEPIDICQVVEGEKGISHFMIAHITPFYEKRWAASCAILSRTALSDSGGGSPRCFFLLPVEAHKRGGKS